MRDSIGGTWIMGIFIVFIALFASFMAYSISYTRAFRVKNEIINPGTVLVGDARL